MSETARKLLSNAEEARRELANRSLHHFVRQMWPILEPGRQFVDNWHLGAMCEHLEAVVSGQIGNLLINVPPGPMRADSLVETNRGMIRLDEVQVGDKVLTHKGRYRSVSAVHEQGVLPILEIVTHSGRVTHAAPSHPYLTPKGWVDAKDLVVGDILAVVNPSEPRDAHSIPNYEARFLGYIVGDGAVTHSPGFVNSDREIVNDFIACASALGFATSVRARATFWHVGVKGARDFLASHGLLGANSYTKRIPDAVRNGGMPALVQFIGAYWSCDGGVEVRKTNARGSRHRSYATTVSEQLAFDLVHCLALIGIEARLRRKSRALETAAQPGGQYKSYSIEIQKESHTAKLVALPSLCRAKREQGEGCVYGFDHPLWEDPIVSIKAEAPSRCLCLTVDEDHSFTCSGIVVKNTMKSLLTSVAFPAWLWGPQNLPQTRIISASYSAHLSLRDARKSRMVIEDRWYQERWGDRASVSHGGDGYYHTDKTGFRLATSTKGVGTGERGDYFICFAGDQTVRTEAGPVAIGDIVRAKMDLRVWSTNIATGKTSLKRITGWHKNPGSRMVRVTLSDGVSVRCTPDHKFWTKTRGWVRADDLRSTDVLPRPPQQNVSD